MGASACRRPGAPGPAPRLARQWPSQPLAGEAGWSRESGLVPHAQWNSSLMPSGSATERTPPSRIGRTVFLVGLPVKEDGRTLSFMVAM